MNGAGIGRGSNFGVGVVVRLEVLEDAIVIPLVSLWFKHLACKRAEREVEEKQNEASGE